MSQRKRIVLDMPATGTGEWTYCLDLDDKWIQFEGLAAGGVVIQLEGRIGEDAGVAIGAPMSTDDILDVPEGLRDVRLNRTTPGTGTPIVTMSGKM